MRVVSVQATDPVPKDKPLLMTKAAPGKDQGGNVRASHKHCYPGRNEYCGRLRPKLDRFVDASMKVDPGG